MACLDGDSLITGYAGDTYTPENQGVYFPILGGTVNLTARPTTYNGIKMRSRLEAKFAAVLDTSGIEWVYEPRAYANAKGQYLPDFQVTRADEPIFIEVRPTVDRGYLAMSQMPIIWDSEPNAALLIVVPGELSFWAEAEDRVWRIFP